MRNPIDIPGLNEHEGLRLHILTNGTVLVLLLQEDGRIASTGIESMDVIREALSEEADSDL